MINKKEEEEILVCLIAFVHLAAPARSRAAGRLVTRITNSEDELRGTSRGSVEKQGSRYELESDRLVATIAQPGYWRRLSVSASRIFH
ncbi:hypothetical protein E2542_SST03964 [Spatholobus suberectus]|nr:hypothetical protein E2542_SST30129 [Spatholobus suberectus]TKY75197.1 hypothetical protein E2542_SST03964 [Spatholobus suberectus]